MANITIIGNLGQDPELKYLENGTAIVSVSIASRRNFKKQGLDYVTDWFRLTLFGKSAENFSNYAHKGSQVYIEGEPQNNEWQDKQGNYRTAFQVVVNNWRLLDKKSDQTTPKPQGNPIEENGLHIQSDELPF